MGTHHRHARNGVPPTIALFEHAPELLRGIEQDLAIELAGVRVPVISLDPGPWQPPPLEMRDRLLALFVAEGVLLRRVTVGGRTGAELVGAGDVLQPWVSQPPQETLEAAARWQVLEPASVAVLGTRFAGDATARIAAALLARATERAHMLAFLHVASHTPGLDVRLGALLWSLADRWGRVTPDGVLLPLRLTHATLAELVGAARPSVSTVLKLMEVQGRVERRREGWLLRGGAPAAEPGSGDWAAAAA